MRIGRLVLLKRVWGCNNKAVESNGFCKIFTIDTADASNLVDAGCTMHWKQPTGKENDMARIDGGCWSYESGYYMYCLYTII